MCSAVAVETKNFHDESEKSSLLPSGVRAHSSSDIGADNEGVNELREREFPSLAKEGCREAAGVSGANASPIGRSNEKRFDQEINYWTNTTPAPISRWATPQDSAEEGNFARLPIHSHLL